MEMRINNKNKIELMQKMKNNRENNWREIDYLN